MMAGFGGAAAVLAAGLGWVAVPSAAAAAGQVLPLRGGFSPDPWLAEVETTGDIAAAEWVRGCPGHLAEAPALRIVLSDPMVALRVVQVGDGLAGLVAEGPDGIFRCAAAGPEGWTALTLDPPLAGDWLLHPSVALPSTGAEARLLISERDLDAAELVRLAALDAGPLMPDAPPAFGTHLLPPDGPLSVAVSPAGSAPAGSVADPACAGWIEPSRPDLVIRLEAEEPVLSIRATGGADLTLVAVDPSGTLSCNDDAYGTDPALIFGPAMAGDWSVWVGTFTSDGAEQALVVVDRALPEPRNQPGAVQLGVDAEPAAGRLQLGPEGVTATFDVTPTAEAAEVEPGCSGGIEPSRPDAAVAVPEGAAALWLRVAAGADATLLAVSPDGTRHCVDDSVGTDPVLQLDAPLAGDWLVWVGLWGSAGPEPVTLQVGPDAASVDLPDGFVPGDAGADSPFLGRDIPDALAALDILEEDPAFAEAVHYAAREALGRQGFRLTDVILHDPVGETAPITVESITLEELDLEGLAVAGAPGRFRLTVSGVDYAALAAQVGEAQAAAMPELAPGTKVGFSLGLLPPDGDDSRRDLSVGLDLEGQINALLTARVHWPDGPGMPENTGSLDVESLRIEIVNHGFLARALDRQAAEIGTTPTELATMVIEGFRDMLAPVEPASPTAGLLDALGQALASPEGPGALRMSVATQSPLGLDALLETLSQSGAAAAREAGLEMEIRYEPLP